MNIYDYKDSPLFKSMIELNEALIKADTEPITLNVVGGFALMIHDMRNKSEFTDIDYVGESLPEQVDKISQKIGVQNGLERHWINNDIMLIGSSLNEFELATGKLHFSKAFELEKIQINVLDTQDLLRLKVIAIDTALSAVDNGGDFTRMKDFRDIIKLSEKLSIPIDSFNERFKDNIVNVGTVAAIQTYKEHGPQAVNEMVRSLQYKLLEENQNTVKGTYKRTSYIDNILNKAIARANEER